MRIGPYLLPNNLALAPMAGVTDLPFRLLCRRMGAGIAAGEMLTSDVRLWRTEKSRRRMDHSGETEPRVVQIAGGDPQMMADSVKDALVRHLTELQSMPLEQLIANREKRLRGYGVYSEG